MRRDNRADIADAHLAVQMRKRGFDGGLRRLGIRKAVGVADKHLACVILSVFGVALHRLDGARDGVFLAADLVIGNDAALVVQTHDGADAVPIAAAAPDIRPLRR